jgi:hypothetical protein
MRQTRTTALIAYTDLRNRSLNPHVCRASLPNACVRAMKND